MLSTFDFRISHVRQWSHQYLPMTILFLLLQQYLAQDLYGDVCEMYDSEPGICELSSKCDEIQRRFEEKLITGAQIKSCGIGTHEEIICCPKMKKSNKGKDRNNDIFIIGDTTTVRNLDTTVRSNTDLWLFPSKSTSTSTTSRPIRTSSTTPKIILQIGNTPLDMNAEFFDFSKLLALGKNQNSIGNGVATDGQILPQTQKLTQTQFPNFNSGEPWANQDTRNLEKPTQNAQFVKFPNEQNSGRRPTMGSGQSISENIFQNPSGTAIRDRPSMSGFMSGPRPGPQGRPATPPMRPINSKLEMIWPDRPDRRPQSQRKPFTMPNVPQIEEPFMMEETGLPNRPIWPIMNNLMNQPIRTVDPIAAVNDNLIHAGIPIIKAQELVLSTNDPRAPVRTTSRPTPQPPAIFSDPFAPFQFRPSQFEEDTIDGNELGSGSNGRTTFNAATAIPTPTPTLTPISEDQSVRRNNSSVPSGIKERPAVKACREILKSLNATDLTPHIIDGIPVEYGEYRHMAAIGFSSIGNDDGPFDFSCGGALIHKRFVLTAAHCVNNPQRQPKIVRLGVVNFDSAEQMANAVEVRIKQIHVHDNYTVTIYNDIALLELARDISSTDYIHPACLYTDAEAPTGIVPPLYVAGWGVVNTLLRKTSKILLKARQRIVPNLQCNETFVKEGPNRRYKDWIIDTQLCATSPFNNTNEDACQGDSGGPLTLVMDEDIKDYRVVGIISAGFNCGGSIPGLYTRVYSFLDYIERIVWPNS